jgi:hypothetical protein
VATNYAPPVIINFLTMFQLVSTNFFSMKGAYLEYPSFSSMNESFLYKLWTNLYVYIGSNYLNSLDNLIQCPLAGTICMVLI